MSLEQLGERFWGHVDKQAANGCWEWTGGRTAKGYGRVYGLGHHYTHRIVAEALYGPLGDAHVLHSCDNPPCVNPAHLSLGTPKENTRQSVERGRATKPPVHRGTAQHRAKLNEVAVLVICFLSARGYTATALAKAHGIGVSAAARVINRCSWKHVPRVL